MNIMVNTFRSRVLDLKMCYAVLNKLTYVHSKCYCASLFSIEKDGFSGFIDDSIRKLVNMMHR